MANIVPNLQHKQLKTLAKLLREYAKHIKGEQPLAAEIIHVILRWVDSDVEDTKS